MFLTAFIVLTACSTLRPGPDCTQLVEVAGKPYVQVEVDGQEGLFLLDTGAPWLTLEPDALLHVEPSGQGTVQKFNWGRATPMTKLMPAVIQFAGRSVTYDYPLRHPEDGPTLGDAEHDAAGILGSYPLAHLAGEVRFEPPETVCLAGMRSFQWKARYPDKTYVVARAGNQDIELLFDTGATKTRILTPEVEQGTALDIEGMEPLEPEPMSEAMKREVFKAGTMEGKTVEGVLGWDVLRTVSWTWEPMAARVRFGDGG